jgi:hypothetical protein
VHEGVRGRQAALEVHRADQGLQGVGQDRRLVAPAGALFTPAEPHVGAEPEGPGHPGQGPHLHHGGPQLGQLALGKVGIPAEQGVRDDQAEDRVAEELEPLVGGQPAVLIRVGTVREGALQQLRAQPGVDGPQQLRTIRFTCCAAV